MPKRSDSHTAQPGMVPAAVQTAGTMVAALYGELAPHPWHDPESEHDAGALFYHRSVAMGWHDDRSTGEPGSAPGLWSTNDAGWRHPRADGETGLVSWFQVEASAVADDRPLPVQPFLRCAHDATAWVGTLRLSAVQLLLPVQGLDPASRAPYAPVPAMRTKEWFAERAPEARTPVQVSVNSGRDPSIVSSARRFTDHLAGLDQDVFVCGSHDIADEDATPPPPFDDGFWNGPPLHGVVLRGDIAEWSCDAVGWLAEVVADSVALLGIRSLLLTITRTSSTG